MTYTRGYGFGYALGLGTKAGGGAAVDPTQTQWSPEYGGGRGLVQHTSWDIRRERDAYFFQTQDEGIAFLDRVRAISSSLPPCTAGIGQVLELGLPVNYRITKTRRPGEDWSVGLLAPMTFEYLGVIFNVADLKNGRITRVYKPDERQRRDGELDIIFQSWNHVFDRGDGPEQIGRTVPNLNWPAKKIEEKGGLFFLANFERNPVQPTLDEYNNEGGLMHWMQRGGYPLSREVVHAQVPIHTFTGKMLSFCTTPLCRQIGTDGSFTEGLPGCQEGFLKTDGKWKTYLAVSQDPASPYFELSFVFQEPRKLEQLANEVGKYLAAFLDLLCKIAPAAAPAIQQQLTAEQCTKETTDAAGKKKTTTCTKGEPNCKCVSPPDATKASAATISYAVSEGCAAWSESREPRPQPTPDPNPQNDPPPPTPAKIPWWVIVLGGIGVGSAIAFGGSREPRR